MRLRRFLGAFATGADESTGFDESTGAEEEAEVDLPACFLNICRRFCDCERGEATA